MALLRLDVTHHFDQAMLDRLDRLIAAIEQTETLERLAARLGTSSDRLEQAVKANTPPEKP